MCYILGLSFGEESALSQWHYIHTHIGGLEADWS